MSAGLVQWFGALVAWKSTFFPVGNGDMALHADDGSSPLSICIDCNIRADADAKDDPTPDVAKQLRSKLRLDSSGRPYVDVFLLTHPDKDHCTGLAKHFYLGDPDDYPDDKKPDAEKRIVIRELWSSPMVFRRASKSHALCEDAKAFNTEAKRRVSKNCKKAFAVGHGDRIQILGEDEDGKTGDLQPILVKTGGLISSVAGSFVTGFSAILLAPFPKGDEDDEDCATKNNSSVVLRMTLSSSGRSGKLLVGGDAEVDIWEKIDTSYSSSSLQYDLLLAPHHCSWHSLSHDSSSEKGDNAEVSKKAKSALSQIRSKGIVVASSKKILDDECDPPSHRAKDEYLSIVNSVGGAFHCVGDRDKTLEFTLSGEGFELVNRSAAVAAAVHAIAAPIKPFADIDG